MALNVATLTAYITANAEPLRKELGRAEKDLDRFGASAQRSAALTRAALGGPGGIALAASAAAGALSPLAGAFAALPAAGAAAGGVLAAVKVGLMGVGDALTESDPEAYAQRLATLSPAARETVVAMRDLGESFAPVRAAVQERLFEGLAGPVQSLGQTYLPVLQVGLSGIAGALNEVVRNVAGFLTEARSVSDVGAILAATETATRNLGGAVVPLLQAFRDLALVGVDFLPGLASGAADAARGFADLVARARESGQLREFIAAGLEAMRDLGVVIGAVLEGVTGAVAPFGLFSGSLSLMADNAGIVTRVIEIALPVFFAYRAAVLAAAVAHGVAAAAAAVTTAVTTAKVVGGWVLMATQATLHAARMAAAWLIAMGPIGWATVAIIAIAALVVAKWDEIRAFTVRAWDAVSQKVSSAWASIKDQTNLAALWIVDKLLWWADKVIGAASTAFSWIPGLGPKLDAAKAAVQSFREKTNAEMDAIRNKDLKVAVDVRGKYSLAEIAASDARRDEAAARRGRGDGPGFHGGGWTGPGSKYAPAGVVHADEFVVRKESRRSLESRAPGLLDHINRTGNLPGYADGGVVHGLDAARGSMVRHTREGYDRAVNESVARMAHAGAARLRRDIENMSMGGGGVFVGGQPMGVQRMMAALNAAFGSVRLISGLRPGAITATGRPSYHGKGRAVDIPPNMAYFEWIRQNFPNSRELIFSPAGARQVNNGRPHVYTGVTRANHWDHVHWAYDRGGLARGMGLLPKMTSAPERVLSPEQTRAFERLVGVLDRGALDAVRTQPVPVEKHYHYHAATGRSLAEEDYIDAGSRARMLGW